MKISETIRILIDILDILRLKVFNLTLTQGENYILSIVPKRTIGVISPRSEEVVLEVASRFQLILDALKH